VDAAAGPNGLEERVFAPPENRMAIAESASLWHGRCTDCRIPTLFVSDIIYSPLSLCFTLVDLFLLVSSCIYFLIY
jgi:hypothetical protein